MAAWTRGDALHLAAHAVAAWANGVTGGEFEGKPVAPANVRRSCAVARGFWAAAAKDGLPAAIVAAAGNALSNVPDMPPGAECADNLDTDSVEAVASQLFPRLSKADPGADPGVPGAHHPRLQMGISNLASAALTAKRNAVKRVADSIEASWKESGAWIWDSAATSALVHMTPG